MTRNFLSQILAQKREIVAQLRRDSSVNRLRDHALETRSTAAPHRLLQALKSELPRLKIIAEFKRRSPSAGTIRGNLSADEVARRYERGGACAISVLTDEAHFGGSIANLRIVRSTTTLPILRKDFIVDPIQVYEGAIAGADAVLLIVAALSDGLLCALRQVAEDELGLDALIEVHTSNELRRALNAAANIIGVKLLLEPALTSAPARISASATADCFCDNAHIKAFWPPFFSFALGSALAASNACTTSTLPRRAACISAVSPDTRPVLGSAPAARSFCVIGSSAFVAVA